MTCIELIDIFWSTVSNYNKAHQDEYRRLYSLMEKGKITQEDCYKQMQLMITDPYYWSRPA